MEATNSAEFSNRIQALRARKKAMKKENQESMNGEHLWSIRESAFYLGCKEGKIRKDIRAGKIKYIKIGTLVRIRKEHLDEIIEANTHIRVAGSEENRPHA